MYINYNNNLILLLLLLKPITQDLAGKKFINSSPAPKITYYCYNNLNNFVLLF